MLNDQSSQETAGDTPDIVPVPDGLSISLPVEEVVDLSVSLWTVFQQLGMAFLPSFWNKDATAWSGYPVARERTAKNKLRLAKLTASDVSQLLLVCRAHQSTLTSFFHAIGAAVLSHVILTLFEDHEAYTTISTLIPLSLRHVAGLGPDVVCDYASRHCVYPPLPSQPFQPSRWQSYFSWDNAAKVAVELREGTPQAMEELGMPKYLFGNYRGFLEGCLGKKRKMGMELSNLGRWPMSDGAPIEEASQWGISDAWFVQGNPTTGAAINVNAVGCPHGGIGLSFTWGDSTINQELAESFVAEFQRAIEQILQDERESSYCQM